MVKKSFSFYTLLFAALSLAILVSCGKGEKENKAGSGPVSGGPEMELLHKIYTGHYYTIANDPETAINTVASVKEKLGMECPGMKTPKAQETCRVFGEAIERYGQKVSKIAEVYDEGKKAREEFLQATDAHKEAEAKMKYDSARLSGADMQQLQRDIDELNKKRIEAGKQDAENKKEIQRLTCTEVGGNKNRPECPAFELESTVGPLFK